MQPPLSKLRSNSSEFVARRQNEITTLFSNKPDCFDPNLFYPSQLSFPQRSTGVGILDQHTFFSAQFEQMEAQRDTTKNQFEVWQNDGKPSKCKYKDFLTEDETHYKDFKILKLESFAKYYRIKRVNPTTNRMQQIMLCKFHNCQAHFNKISNLIDHLNVHDQVKPYKCKNCGKGFVQFGNMRRHISLCAVAQQNGNSSSSKPTMTGAHEDRADNSGGSYSGDSH